MSKPGLLIAGVVAAMVALAGAASVPAHAAEGAPKPPRESWSFSGPFGTYDRAQLQRGFKVYREVCSSCHGLGLVAFRNLAEPGGPEFSEAQVKALAATYQIHDGPNDAGDMFDRPGRPADRFPLPFPNEQAARASNGGAFPPDFSLLAKARTFERGFPWFLIDAVTQYQEQGPDYIHGIINGYVPAPAGFELQPGQHYNEYFPGHRIAMPKPINDGQVEYPKLPNGQPQVPETVDQYSRDVTAFMMWAAEPHLEARKQMGFKVMVFLIVFAGLLYFTKKKIWAKAHDEEAKA
ncbi:cytochrome c1 [Chelatococcus asaccharovorans]|uniref:Cytochrome c1 n=1 Tax=Chelatococcus asaccharovorans TaxID=28210 RepID=A0A2V3U056_9HYPH|nr:cytochrome c1 [Chelatococcus asaccharovorans]MBS7704436.1 cytochrome c1 [Chelatococcus asaccharovorans]PXW55684.1 cytochrome c1 [Chelatococcus asaccharovorans]CAH1663701.1 ubiquinol cytochrome C oxidoreductase, cytochrome C1 subunit [Chelatococcus asaccharovorans]CAH1682713.1 ubiquinol cytochrome C oxidoreductase, cytochrome C1 subunit [Chelatococcus asaccharovorans]